MKETPHHKYIKKYISTPTSDDINLKISVELGTVYASTGASGYDYCENVCDACKIGIKVQPAALTVCPRCGSPAVKRGNVKIGWYGCRGVWYRCGTVSNICKMFYDSQGNIEDCMHVTSVYIGSGCTQEEDVI